MRVSFSISSAPHNYLPKQYEGPSVYVAPPISLHDKPVSGWLPQHLKCLSTCSAIKNNIKIDKTPQLLSIMWILGYFGHGHNFISTQAFRVAVFFWREASHLMKWWKQCRVERADSVQNPLRQTSLALVYPLFVSAIAEFFENLAFSITSHYIIDLISLNVGPICFPRNHDNFFLFNVTFELGLEKKRIAWWKDV